MFEFDISYLEILQNWLHATNIIDLLVKGAFFYFALFWFALLVWVTRDVINRTNNVAFQVLVILLNTFLPIFGLVIYLLIRPSRTLLEKYYDDLEYKALSIEKFCPKCSVAVGEDFAYCPECATSLKTACNHCSKESFLSFKNCPYCGKNKKTKKASAKTTKKDK